MPRRSRPVASPTLAAAVRQHFGLTQAELAAFVGVSQQALAAVEAGRKQLGPGPDRRLQVLARQLPPPDGLGPPAPAFEGSAAPAATETPAPADPTAAEAALAPLRARLARCQWLRTQLRFQRVAQGRRGGRSVLSNGIGWKRHGQACMDGIATRYRVAALIGGGGFGVFVFQGIGQTAMDLVLLGVIPTVALCFLASVVLGALIELAAPGRGMPR